MQLAMATFSLLGDGGHAALAAQGAPTLFSSRHAFGCASLCLSFFGYYPLQLTQHGELTDRAVCGPFVVQHVRTAGEKVRERAQLCGCG